MPFKSVLIYAAARRIKFKRFFKTLRPKRKALDFSYVESIEISPEYPPDLPEAATELEGGNNSPLQEAEVFLAFGRVACAKTVLDSALKDGALTHDEVDRFWEKSAED